MLKPRTKDRDVKILVHAYRRNFYIEGDVCNQEPGRVPSTAVLKYYYDSFLVRIAAELPEMIACFDSREKVHD